MQTELSTADCSPESVPPTITWPARTTPSSTLADLTTLRVGGAPRRYVETTTEAELLDAVRAADADGEPLLVLGGGSNLLVADAGFDGAVVRDVRSGIEVPDCRRRAPVPRRSPRDALGRRGPVRGRGGADRDRGALRHPGLHGRDAGAERRCVRPGGVAEHRDRPGLGPGRGKVRTLPLVTLAFGYRTSLLKRSMREADPADPQAPVADAAVRGARREFQLRPGSLRARSRTPSSPARSGSRSADAPRSPTSATPCSAPARRKGMVLDAADHDTWSAGSFFTNPSSVPPRRRCAAGRRAALPGRRRPRQDERRLAHRAGRVLARASAPPARRPCRPSTRSRSTNRGTAKARGPARARPSGARRRPGVLRGRAGARARAGGRHALTPEQRTVHQHERLVVGQPGRAHR